jgi:radical SAM superfamily enzyme YgiQ (UPF0313 family)
LGLGYVAAAVENREYNVGVLDFCNGYINENMRIADIYGMQITAPQVDVANQIAGLIKIRYPNSIVVAGGPQMLVDKDRFINSPDFDSVIVGEGEFSLYELIRQYELTGEVDSVYWNPPIKLLDDIPFPARHLFPNFKKDALRTHQLLKGDYTDGGQTTIIASRGCPWECSFCAPHSKVLRYRSVSNVIDELRHLINEYGIYQFKWQDDTFTTNKYWIKKLCKCIIEDLPTTYHRAHTRVNVFDAEMAEIMYRAGFRVLCFGIESFSQRLLDINNKQITVAQIERALAIAKVFGFKTVGFLIYGMPGEDRASVDETKVGILKNKKHLDYLNLATMVPLPGTPIEQDPEKFYVDIIEKDLSKFWIVDHEATDDVLVKTKGVSLKEMKKLKTEMYQFMRDEGYSRPEWKN